MLSKRSAYNNTLQDFIRIINCITIYSLIGERGCEKPVGIQHHNVNSWSYVLFLRDHILIYNYFFPIFHIYSLARTSNLPALEVEKLTGYRLRLADGLHGRSLSYGIVFTR